MAKTSDHTPSRLPLRPSSATCRRSSALRIVMSLKYVTLIMRAVLTPAISLLSADRRTVRPDHDRVVPRHRKAAANCVIERGTRIAI